MIIVLNSVGCLLNDETGMVYPMTHDGTYDADNAVGTVLQECDEEWFDALNEADRNVVVFYMWLLYKHGTIFNGLPNRY
jgi:hypothetical protein